MTEGYEHFRKNKEGRSEGEVAPYTKWIDCEELPLKNIQEQAESLWAKLEMGPMKDSWNTKSIPGCLIEGRLLTRPPCFSCKRHCIHRLSSLWGFQPPRYLLEKQHGELQAVQRLLESTEDNFLVQILDRLTRCEALLNLLLTSSKEMF